MGKRQNASEQIRKAVERAPFPSTRKQLVDFISIAHKGRVTEELKKLPDREYRDVDDVLRAMQAR